MLAVKNITKKFSGVTALNNVSLVLNAGEVTAIIGENGAGKSTLMKILSGVYPDYEGTISFKDQVVRFSNPKEAQEKGITIIHQELNLVPFLTVTENIFLGREILTRWGTLDKKAMAAKTKTLLDRLRLTISPDTMVYALKVGQQQVVEIAKALLLESDLIIMDEPTSAISESEVDVLFSIIEDLRKEGKAIAYISHKLDELFKIADRYIIMRDGQVIEDGRMNGTDHDGIISKMVGRSVNMVRKADGIGNSETILAVRGLNLQHRIKEQGLRLKDISFTVNRGEIVGVFGLMGAGRTELLETVFGLHPNLCSGSLTVNGNALAFKSPCAAIAAGLALVPEDRKKDGLMLGLNVRKNISITTLEALSNMGFLDNKKECSLSGKYIDELRIKSSSDRQLAGTLSGGNQQKIVLAKWLATNPVLLMLDEPTRGIDINAKNEIYKLILKLAAAGLGIIMVSSELPEILAVSDRVLVMAEGCLTASLPINEATEDRILKCAIPKTI
ncbi:sugar ABC transporter ATP-binding protein [Segetibacter sp. 3557_3]|uniref:sugar ABC transporter ATP-binding protein n=1 Tax=Segetibacter sp. 3557_3 TaxID=2547429 RepID=UPI0010583FC4|nr:sugar ABC transporter ATP-binding protein [Segetibacter sp. 3557_3]TDH27466.1 sugar ABC transporter ATP-binding protein [Segetibacter sp. 3557_3]